MKKEEVGLHSPSHHDQLLAIFNTVSDAMFSVTASGTIRLYNAALLSLLDTNQSLSGKKLDDVLPLVDLHSEPVSLMALLQSASHVERDDLLFQFTDDDAMRLHVSANKIRQTFTATRAKSEDGYICTLRDVTKAKSLEEERDEFISVVSHELRTPVAIAEGTISNLQYFMQQGAKPEKLTPALAEAHEQVVLLSNMINDLSTLSRAERGVGDSLENINIRELAEELFKKYEPAASKKGLALNLDLGASLGHVNTSRLYLEEMLQNFITNAIKYTQTGTVTISIHATHGNVEFSVKDSGIGISTSDLKHIFEKFYRSEDYRTRETSGTGLGLYVVQKLMHKLGAKVTVTSKLNVGSTFSFSLPQSDSKKSA